MSQRRTFTDGDWLRLADAITKSRMDSDRTQGEVAAAAGVGRSTIQMIEKGHAFPKPNRLRALPNICNALGWPDGYWRLVLEGAKNGPPKTVKSGDRLHEVRSESLRVLSSQIGDSGVLHPDIPTSELYRLGAEVGHLQAQINSMLAERFAMQEKPAPTKQAQTKKRPRA